MIGRLWRLQCCITGIALHAAGIVERAVPLLRRVVDHHEFAAPDAAIDHGHRGDGVEAQRASEAHNFVPELVTVAGLKYRRITALQHVIGVNGGVSGHART